MYEYTPINHLMGMILIGGAACGLGSSWCLGSVGTRADIDPTTPKAARVGLADDQPS